MKLKRIKKTLRNALVFTMAFLVATSTLATAYATYANIVIEHIWVDNDNKGGERDKVTEILGGGIQADVTADKVTGKDENGNLQTEDINLDKVGDGEGPAASDTVTDDGSTAGDVIADKLKPEEIVQKGEQAGIKDGSTAAEIEDLKEQIKDIQAPDKPTETEPEIPEAPEGPGEEPVKPEEPGDAPEVPDHPGDAPAMPPKLSDPENATEEDWAEYEAAMLEWETQMSEYNTELDQYNEAVSKLEEYEKAKNEYPNKLAEYDKAKAEYELKKEAYEKNKAEYDQKKAEYDKAKEEYDQKMAEYDQKMADYAAAMEKYQAELEKWSVKYGNDAGFKDGFFNNLTDEEKAAYDKAYWEGFASGKDNPVKAPELGADFDQAIKDALAADKQHTMDQVEEIEGKTDDENKWAVGEKYNAGDGNGEGLYDGDDKNPIHYWAEISEDSKEALQAAGYESVLMKVTIETVETVEGVVQATGRVYVSLDGGKSWVQSKGEEKEFNPTEDLIGTTTFTFLHVLEPEKPTPPTPPDRPSFDYEPEEPEPPEEPPEEPEEPDEEIPDPDVPLAPPPEEEIPEPDVPLADVPETGDNSVMWTILVLSSVTGLLAVALLERKKVENS